MITNTPETVWTLTLEGRVILETSILSEALREAYGCGGMSLWSGDCRVVRNVGSTRTQEYDMAAALSTLAVHNRQTRILLLSERSTAEHRRDYYVRLRKAIKAGRLHALGAPMSAVHRPMSVIRQSAGYRNGAAAA